MLPSLLCNKRGESRGFLFERRWCLQIEDGQTSRCSFICCEVEEGRMARGSCTLLLLWSPLVSAENIDPLGAVALTHRKGAIVSPVQSIFLSTKTVQTPAYLGYVSRLTSIPDRFGDYNGEDPDNMLAPAQLRSAVTSTTSTDPQVRLWTAAGALNCTNSTAQTSNACASGQISLRNMSLLQDPFVAQLPAGYNTGLVRQFMPRINSTVYRERIAPDEFPPDCGNLHNSFYVNYSDIVMTGFDGGKPVGISWSLVACMPSDQRQSPWRNTQERQDFSEILFLNLSAYAPNPTPTTVDPDLWSGYFKLTMNTTAGYFELPNYMNDQIPGPLLDDAPVSQCGIDCLQQNNPYTAAYSGERQVQAYGISTQSLIAKTAPAAATLCQRPMILPRSQTLRFRYRLSRINLHS